MALHEAGARLDGDERALQRLAIRAAMPGEPGGDRFLGQRLQASVERRVDASPPV